MTNNSKKKNNNNKRKCHYKYCKCNVHVNTQFKKEEGYQTVAKQCGYDYE